MKVFSLNAESGTQISAPVGLREEGLERDKMGGKGSQRWKQTGRARETIFTGFTLSGLLEGMQGKFR